MRLFSGAALLGVVACQWQWESRWSWDRIQTLTWGTNSSCCPIFENRSNAHCCNAFDNETEVAFKSKFDVIFQDNDLNSPGCRVGIDTLETCLKTRSASAAALKAAAPTKKVLDYRGIIVAWWNYQTPDHDHWWIKGDTPDSKPMHGVIDWRVPDAAEYFIDKVIGPSTLNDPNIDGVFVDSGFCIAATAANLTLQSRREMLLAELSAFKTICSRMADKGKIVTVSLKTHFSNNTEAEAGMHMCPADMDASNTTACMPYGEELVFAMLGATRGFIPHRQFNIPSRDFGDAAHHGVDKVGCAAAILDLQAEAAYGPTLITNNDGAPRGYGGVVNTSVTWHGQHNVSLAAFLLGMQPQSFFGSGLHWSDSGWTVAWPEFSRRLGQPTGLAQRGSGAEKYLFRRSFEGLDLELDCAGDLYGGGGAKFKWK